MEKQIFLGQLASEIFNHEQRTGQRHQPLRQLVKRVSGLPESHGLFRVWRMSGLADLSAGLDAFKAAA